VSCPSSRICWRRERTGKSSPALDASDAVAAGEFDASAESDKLVDFARLGQKFPNEAVRVLQKNASGVAGFGVVDDPAVAGIGGVFRDAGDRKRLGVDPHGVRIVRLEEDGAIEKGAVEVAAIGKGAGAENRIVPAARNNPVVAGIFLGVARQDFQDIGNGLGVFEIGHAKTRGAGVEVHVAVSEARDNNPCAGIDHSGTDAAHALDLFLPADRDDLSLANRDALRPGVRRIEREDFGVKDDDVGRCDAG